MLRSKLTAAAVVVAAGLIGYAAIPGAPGSAVGDEQALRVTGGATASAPHNQSITSQYVVCGGNLYPDGSACGTGYQQVLGGPGYYCYTNGVCSKKWTGAWQYCGYGQATACA